jgi:hypothetical protein
MLGGTDGGAAHVREANQGEDEQADGSHTYSDGWDPGLVPVASVVHRRDVAGRATTLQGTEQTGFDTGPPHPRDLEAKHGGWTA